jgi:hypothetical protein
MGRRIALTLVAGLTLTCTASADAYIYWANRDNASVGRARTNGKGVDESYIGTGASIWGVAVDANHIYWSDRTKGRIGRVKRNGKGFDNKFVTGLDTPHGIDVDNDHIYWSDADGIGRADIDGSNVTRGFIANGGGNVEVDAHNIYWSSASGIARANLDGTQINQAFVAAAAYGIAVTSKSIYWAYFTYNPKIRGGVGRANLNGSGVEKKFVSVKKIFPQDVAVDDAHVWWVEQSGIGRSSLEGKNIKSRLIKHHLGHGTNGLVDIAVDPDGTPPLTSIKKHPPKRTHSGTARFVFAASEANSTFTCKLDKHGWKHCDASYELEHLNPGDHKLAARAIDEFGNVDPTPAKAEWVVK